MPTYEYKCPGCARQFEIIQRMSDEPLVECPECNGPVKRLIGAGAGIIFKGSGFYTTDYRSDSYRKGAEAAKKSDAPATPEKTEKATPKTTESSSTSAT